MNKNIIIAILILIIIAIGAAFVLGGQNSKMDTQINILNADETFQNGEQVQFELKDDQGKAISGKTVDITFNNQKFSITTDQNGKGYLTITGMASGKYDVEVSFAGDDTYNGCDSKASITIDADSAADNPAQQTEITATNATTNKTNDTSGWTYYPEWDAYVDSNGIVVQIGDGSGEQLGVGMPIDDFSRLMHGEDVYHVYDDNDTASDDDSSSTDDSDSDA